MAGASAMAARYIPTSRGACRPAAGRRPAAARPLAAGCSPVSFRAPRQGPPRAKRLSSRQPGSRSPVETSVLADWAPGATNSRREAAASPAALSCSPSTRRRRRRSQPQRRICRWRGKPASASSLAGRQWQSALSVDPKALYVLTIPGLRKCGFRATATNRPRPHGKISRRVRRADGTRR